jgi:hypothetical protein
MERLRTPRSRLLLRCGLWMTLLIAAQAGAETPGMHYDLITDRSGASEAVGPSAVKWGFMCSIAARHGQSLYAINFTRTPDVAWDVRDPNEAPVAFWKQQPNGSWTSTLLDSPTRTYQTPSLLLGPDGRANVFTLKAGGDTLYWFHSQNAENSEFKCTGIPMDWGAYLGGGIDPQGRALMVYWANYHPDPTLHDYDARKDGYGRSTIGYTLIDTVTGKHKNGTMDSPGAPYCYSQVAYARNGAHVLTVKSIVSNFLISGSRNHYTELRYYYSPDPWSDTPWKHVTLYENPRTQLQPLGLEVDHAGRAHLLYIRRDEMQDGQGGPGRLFYAVSRQPLSAHSEPEFVQHEIKSDGWDGRLFQTRNGHLYILIYQSGVQAQLAEIQDGLAGKFTPWEPIEMPVQQCRIFPIGQRGGSTLTDDLEGVLVGLPGSPVQSNLYHFRFPVGKAHVAAVP